MATRVNRYYVLFSVFSALLAEQLGTAFGGARASESNHRYYAVPTVCRAELLVAYDRLAATETEASRLAYCESPGSCTRVGTPTGPK